MKRLTRTVALAATLIGLSAACGHRPPNTTPAPPRSTPEASATKSPLDSAVDVAKDLLPFVCPAWTSERDSLVVIQRCVTGPFLRDGKVPAFVAIKRCVLESCGYEQPTAAPSSAPTAAPPAPTATSAPTSTPHPVASDPAFPGPTATVTASNGWVVRMKWVNGFGGCNPYPCDPTTPSCAAQRNIQPGTGKDLGPKYPVRTSCRGDRTQYFDMPDFNLVAKGASCPERCVEMNAPNLADCESKCYARDSPGTPCGGAPACDRDHLGCARVAYGCGGKVAHDDPRGSLVEATPDYPGAVGCDNGDGFSLSCSGTPGSVFEICARPYADAHDADGIPLLSRADAYEKSCRKGWF